MLGLYREAECSPGHHRSNDVLLIERVAQSLRAAGVHVELLALDDVDGVGRPPVAGGVSLRSASIVFSMCQARASLQRLSAWERAGVRIVNSPAAALETHRDRLASVMHDAGIPFPPTTLVSTRDSRGPDVNGGVWLKRGDVHASIAADVQWVDSTARLGGALSEFAARGIERAVVQPHVAGDEIKFYGVAGGRFFHWFYTGGAEGYPFDPQALAQLAEAAAAAARLDVFGGDVIVSSSGDLTLIDLNDWPSFAPCREQASCAIAEYLVRLMDGAWSRWNGSLVASADESTV